MGSFVYLFVWDISKCNSAFIVFRGYVSTWKVNFLILKPEELLLDMMQGMVVIGNCTFLHFTLQYQDITSDFVIGLCPHFFLCKKELFKSNMDESTLKIKNNFITRPASFWTLGIPEGVLSNRPCPSAGGPSVRPSLNISETAHWFFSNFLHEVRAP